MEWRLLEDEELALSAEIEDVIFGNDEQACQVQLEQRFPASDPRLTRVRKRSRGGYDKLGRYCDKPAWRVCEPDSQFYDGDDEFAALALAKEFGAIRCKLDHRSYSSKRSKHGVDWKAEGCVLRPPSGGYHSHIDEIVYNPKGVLRARKAAETRAKNAPVRCGDISQAMWEMRTIVREHIPSLGYESPDGRYSRYSVCWLLLETVKYFVFIFGAHSYRKHPAFRKLKTLWKKHAERSRKAFYEVGQYSETLCKFCNFMDAEIRIRNGCLIDKKQNWKPKGKFPDFYEYAPCAYDKVLRARAKKEAAAARAKERRTAKAKPRSA